MMYLASVWELRITYIHTVSNPRNSQSQRGSTERPKDTEVRKMIATISTQGDPGNPGDLAQARLGSRSGAASGFKTHIKIITLTFCGSGVVVFDSHGVCVVYSKFIDNFF